MFKHTKVRALTLLFILTLVVSACGKAGSNEPAASQPAAQQSSSPDAQLEDVEINFMHWRSEDRAVLDEIIDAFHEKHPNIKVTQSTFPSEEYRTVAQQKLLDGKSGDVFTVFPGSQYEGLLKANLMADLTGKPFVDSFIPNLIDKGATDGKQYALPYHLVYNMPLINVRIFEELNLQTPTTWEEYLEVCQVLKDNGYIPIAFPGGDIGPGQMMNPMLMNENTDEDMFVKLMTGETKLTDDWYVESLKKWDELNKRGFIQANSPGTKFDAAITLFVTEKAAMLGTGSFHVALILEQVPDMQLDMLPPITVSSPDDIVFEGVHNTTFMLAINQNSTKKEAAEKFIEFLATPEMAGKYANETGQLGVVKNLEYSSPSLQFKTNWAEKKTRFLPRSTIPTAEIETAITNSIIAVITGIEPEKAAENAQQIVDQQR